MTLHTLVCLLQLGACLNFVFDYPGSLDLGICLMMDLICQLIVVNIVRTQGCNEMMNRYTIGMSRDLAGGLKLSFIPKPSQ
jgi:hypothetical protein